MCDEHHRAALGLPEIDQQFFELELGLSIQRAERLIHQQHTGIERESSGQRAALAHAV
ncbi:MULTISPECIES: hypothetical protein [Pandoraea]|uniref:hypothetical protein n=1 Tax=Pandoraea TaxID=93217 RepID=UPI0003C75772|nr:MULTISPECIES: hypothetical protein [Pandoraea]